MGTADFLTEFVGFCWLLLAFCWLLLAFVGFLLAFVGFFVGSVGFCWLFVSSIGLAVPRFVAQKPAG